MLCYAYLYYFTVRLVYGLTKYEGTVEVYHNGEWGRVCDNGWDLNDAHVLCRELGFANAISTRHHAFYGRSIRRFSLGDLQCVGTEWTIRNCSQGRWGGYSCSSHNYAGVKCASGNIICGSSQE